MLEVAMNETFADGQVRFVKGEGGLSKAVISNAFCEGELYLHGAHITHFCPRGAEPVLWLSPTAVFAEDKAIRGGIPVCWPWFGPHPSDPTLPQHGFARTARWEFVEAKALVNGDIENAEAAATLIRLQLSDTEESRATWPHAFHLELTATFGRSLKVELTTRNENAESIEIGGALHSYFRVADIDHVSVLGLESQIYVDQLEGHCEKSQCGAIRFDGEVDRVYTSANPIFIADQTRRLSVESWGSGSAVVWNPWIEKSQRMADFPDNGYRSMVCVESANAGQDRRAIAAGQSHTLSQTITIDERAW